VQRGKNIYDPKNDLLWVFGRKLISFCLFKSGVLKLVSLTTYLVNLKRFPIIYFHQVSVCRLCNLVWQHIDLSTIL
jgi:hypothetical protein